MPILKSHRTYINFKKRSCYVETIIPVNDIEVSDVIYKNYIDITDYFLPKKTIGEKIQYFKKNFCLEIKLSGLICH